MNNVVEYYITFRGDCFEQTVTWRDASSGEAIYRYVHEGLADEYRVIFDYRDNNCIYKYKSM